MAERLTRRASERHADAGVAVVGGGILGVLSALLIARQGRHVTLFERNSDLWSGATAMNEGKVHLGPVYALGTRRTWSLMREGALAFSSIIEAAVGGSIDWNRLTSASFDYLVMPDSLAGPDVLGLRYAAMNTEIRRRGESGSYLGVRIRDAIEERPSRDERTGLPRFRSREQAVDPLALGSIVKEAAAAQSLIEVRSSTEVTSIVPAGDRCVCKTEAGDHRFAAVVNCTWEERGLLAPSAAQPTNFRIKVAVMLHAISGLPSVTLVHGPFGDVVGYPARAYASWYPVARLAHAVGIGPSSAVRATCARADLPANAATQVEALRAIGVLPVAAQVSAVGAGFVLGEGHEDIDRPHSRLHSRESFGVARDGCVVTPLNFKFSTAPLAALRAASQVMAILDG